MDKSEKLEKLDINECNVLALQDQFKTLKVDLFKSVSQSSHAVRHVNIRPSFAQGIDSDVTAKPIGETVSVSTRNLSFEDKRAAPG